MVIFDRNLVKFSFNKTPAKCL